MICLAIKDLAGRKHPLAKTYVQIPSFEFNWDFGSFSRLKPTYGVCSDWCVATPLGSRQWKMHKYIWRGIME